MKKRDNISIGPILRQFFIPFSSQNIIPHLIPMFNFLRRRIIIVPRINHIIVANFRQINNPLYASHFQHRILYAIIIKRIKKPTMPPIHPMILFLHPLKKLITIGPYGRDQVQRNSVLSLEELSPWGFGASPMQTV